MLTVNRVSVKQRVPARLLDTLRPMRSAASAWRHRGDSVVCPVCDRGFSRFLEGDFGHLNGLKCPYCRSFERQRQAWLFLERSTDLFRAPTRLLHFAPEEGTEARFKECASITYLSADIASPRAMSRQDLMALTFDEGAFDAAICSHVLEHVPDDTVGMAELFRVLRPGGWAIVEVPIDDTLATTYEDWTITSNAGREAAFGQWDHVRVHGRDFADRLRSVGFDVQVSPLRFSPDECVRYGLAPDQNKLFFCVKPGDDARGIESTA